MTHINIRYDNPNPAANDSKALADLQDWLNHKQWEALTSMAKRHLEFRFVVMGLSIAGVSGFPVHAFGRKYMAEEYNAWMEANDD